MNSSSTRYAIRVALLAGLILLAGCARLKHPYAPTPEVEPRKPIAPEASLAYKAPPASDGSLWTAAVANPFTDDKAFRPGDIILVKVVHENTGAQNADTGTKRSSSITGTLRYLFGLEKPVNKLTDYTNKERTSANWTPNPLIDATASSEFSGEGSTNRSDTLEATVSAVVTQLLPNGNLAIYGHQTVSINNEASVLTVQGIVRPSDIGRDNTVDSMRIANADIRFTGSGVVSDKQHPGWGTRLVDWAWPF